MEQLFFEDFDEVYLDSSWKWMNDPEVRDLIMGARVTKEEQRHWFETLKKRDDYLIWGIRVGSKRIGAVGIKHIDRATKKGEYFGYIGEKEYWGRGIGKDMLQTAVNRAREMDLVKLYLNVSKSNIRAIRLYEKYGFIMRHVCDHTYYMDMDF